MLSGERFEQREGMAAVFRQWARGTPGLGDTWTARTQKLLGAGTPVIRSLLLQQ